MTGGLREATDAELADWDRRAVDARGGHVYQSRAWAAHRAAKGWTPRFLVFDDGFPVLALERSWSLVGGGSAYVPRGPVPTDADPDCTAMRLLDVTDWLADRDIDVVAADAEVPAASDVYRRTLRAGGFRPIEEIQPSRHRLTLPLDCDEERAFGGIDKKTRNRIRRAERELEVACFDARGGAAAGTAATEPDFEAFYDLLRATGDRLQFGFGPRSEFVAWWRRGYRAGHIVHLEARLAGETLAALLLYRHGGRLSTVHSADRADRRRDQPGALALLRWTAIRLAIAGGCDEMDLGGADVRGARRIPREDEPMYGLYQHKLAFGATWLELTGAHERVIRPWRYAAGRIARRVARRIGRAGAGA